MRTCWIVCVLMTLCAVASAKPNGAPAQAMGNVSTPSVSFDANSLVIPMDNTYQSFGMFRAYGLVYRLLLNNITVNWVINKPNGSMSDTDLTLSVSDIATSATIPSAAYRGGPFVIASADRAAALALISAWNQTTPTVTVHSASVPFTAEVARRLDAAPRVAVLADGSEIISFNNLNAAGIPDSTGQAWPVVADVGHVYGGWPDVLTVSAVRGASSSGPSDGALLRPDGTPAYCFVTSAHYGVTPDDEVVRELRSWLTASPATHAFMQCASVSFFENSPDGRFLSTAGLMDDGSIVSNVAIRVPTDPLTQSDGNFSTQMGVVDSIGLTLGSTLRSNTKTLINRPGSTLDSRIVLMSGPIGGDASQGKVTYFAGHEYSTALPLSANLAGNGVRLFLNSIFESACATAVGQPTISFTNAAPALTNAQTITYTLSYANAGPGVADTLRITSTIPPGTTFVSASSGGAYDGPTRTVTWNALGNLAVNAAGTVNVTVSVASDGTYPNSATLQYFASRTSRSVMSNTATTLRDATAPDTTLVSGPATTTAATNATLVFTSSDASATFECAMDSPTYVACLSPMSFTGLSVGTHTFTVRARDAAGNVDASPATRTWTVDPNAPAPCSLDIDGDGKVLAPTDGLLVLRRMYGLGNEALRAHAYNPSGTRLAASDMMAAIDPMIATKTLDIDGNGTVEAATDGILLLRALLGLGGSAVTNGALGTGAPTRATWPAIRQYLVNTCELSNLAP